MKTIGTVINTVVVVSGMLCSLIAGAFVGYSMAKDEKSRYMNRRPYTSYTSYTDLHKEHSRGYSEGYEDGWKECKEAYGDDEKEESENEDI